MSHKTIPRRNCRSRRRSHHRPPLRLTPYAWAKLLCLRDLGPTEVGGFGVSPPDDLLLVEDVHLVQQLCSAVTVKFADQSVADYFDDQVDAGRRPEEFARIWIHTHPSDSPYPSLTDEETFARCFSDSEWAVMLIVAQGGQTYARLRFGTGPGGELVLPVEVDFQAAFGAADSAAWESEYGRSVSREPERLKRAALTMPPPPLGAWPDDRGLCLDGALEALREELAREPIHAPF